MRLLSALTLLSGQLLIGSAGSSSASLVHIDLLTGSDEFPETDGSAGRPFRTLAGWAARGGTAPQVSGLNFGPGLHSLVATGGLVLATSGTADAPFVVSGAGLGKTQLTAAVQVGGFAEHATEAGAPRQWRTTLPINTSYFRQLFVRPSPAGNFTRRLTARSSTLAYNHSVKTNPQYAIVYNEGQVRFLHTKMIGRALK